MKNAKSICHFNLSGFENAVVLGGGHGIGLSLVKRLINENSTGVVYATYRDASKASDLVSLRSENAGRLHLAKVDAEQEQDFADFADMIGAKTDHVDVVLCCIGYLHENDIKPEKSLKDIESAKVLRAFQVNSIPSLLAAKYLMPLLKNPKPAVFVSLSARVGSVSDNRSGGWYAYRASKCALNMFLKNISIEFEHYHCNTLVLAIHPGTTVTDLSRPYLNKSNRLLHTPKEAAENILSVVSNRTIKDSGGFYDWKGELVLW